MKPLPIQERARKKRQAILEAARQEFSEHGYEQSTAKSIALRADVATGTFYQHFNNKDEALLEISRQRFASVSDRLALWVEPEPVKPRDRGNVRAMFTTALEFIYDFHAKDARLHELIEQRRPNDPALNALMHEKESILLKQTEAYVASTNVDEPETVAYCIFAMTEGLVHRHVFQTSILDKSRVIAHGVNLLSSFFE